MLTQVVTDVFRGEWNGLILGHGGKVACEKKSKNPVLAWILSYHPSNVVRQVESVQLDSWRHLTCDPRSSCSPELNWGCLLDLSWNVFRITEISPVSSHWLPSTSGWSRWMAILSQSNVVCSNQEDNSSSGPGQDSLIWMFGPINILKALPLLRCCYGISYWS